MSIEVHQAADNSYHVTFGDYEGLTVRDLVAALASLPPGAPVFDVCTTFHDEDGAGQSDYDAEHIVGITTISTDPDVVAHDVIAEAEAFLAGGTS